MKISVLLLALSTVLFLGCKNEEGKASIIDMHNSENSLDWAGVYEGVTPCADCEGIETVLELKSEKTYILSMTYLGRPEVGEYKQQGEFIWNETGSQISLQTDGEPIKLKVGENKVWMLDGSGNVIEGDMEERFILTKTN